jgi:hypothetical protein
MSCFGQVRSKLFGLNLKGIHCLINVKTIPLVDSLKYAVCTFKVLAEVWQGILYR